MKSLSPYCIFLIAISAFSISPALAQWEYGGKVIGLRSTSTSGLAVAHIGDGNIVVAWDRIRGGDYDIYAQCIDSAGYEMWGEGGMVVYEDDGVRQDFPALLPDGEGGVFVVWSDWRHTSQDGIALYGQRLDSFGNYLWDPEGVRLTADTMSHEYADLQDDGHDGFVAVYRSRYGWGMIDVGAQRVDSQGSVLWGLPGIALTQAYFHQSYPKTCRATDSTFITCWRDYRFHNTDFEDDIYMQRFDLEGNVLWDPDGIPAVLWPEHQGYLDVGHDIVADGHGGAVVVWVDGRTLYNSVLFADRFSSSGQSLWQLNGLQLGSNLLYEALECQAFKVGSNFMFRWGRGEFMVSYLSLDGHFIWNEPVVLDTSHVYTMFMEPDGVFKFKTAYVGEPFSYGAGAKVDTTGFRFWPDYPFIGRDIISESDRILTDGYDGMITVWKASGSMDIKIAKIYADGHVGGDSNTAVFEDDLEEPDIISLFQNYPNPFNRSTTIRYRLAEKSDVMVEIFDLLGRKILDLALGDQPAEDCTYRLNMEAYPSGIYFLRISTDAGSSKKTRMLLLK